MESVYLQLLDVLRSKGWTIDLCSEWQSMPSAIEQRYSWLPSALKVFLRSLKTMTNPDNTVWVNTIAELTRESGSAFAWNEWELQSLDAASDDQGWYSNIIKFWDLHFPVLMSVKDGYAYCAIRPDGQIVFGENPEYEESTCIATSFIQFLQLLIVNPASVNA